MRKRAQTTIFILIAILVITIIIIYFLFNNGSLSLRGEDISPEVEPIYWFILDCYKESAEISAYNIAEKGGYYYTPESSTDNFIPYYLYLGKDNTPSIKKLQEELNKEFINNYFLCKRNFIDFPDSIIKENSIKVNSEIFEENIKFWIENPITISKGNKNYMIKKSELFEVSVNLGKAYYFAKKIVNERKNNSESICISCLSSEAKKKDLDLYILQYGNSSLIYYIKDYNSLNMNKNFSYIFAERYK